MPRILTPPSRHAEAWSERLARVPTADPATALGLARGDAVLVVGAHPDDETIGLGGTVAALSRSGIAVHLLCATAGERAYDAAGVVAPGLADRRRAELRRAWDELGGRSAVVAGLPDGGLADHEDVLAGLVAEHAGRTHARHVLALWPRDPHPDHAAVGRAASRAAGKLGLPVSGYPVWAYHWTDPAEADLHDGRLTLMVPDAAAAAARRRALRHYLSQTVEPAEGTGPVVPAEVTACTLELLVTPAPGELGPP